MKAKVIFAAIAALVCVSVSAQNTEKKWRWTTEVETQIGADSNFGVGATFGYQFTQRLYAGIGSDFLIDSDCSFPTIIAPIFAVAKIDLLKEARTPVIDLRGGVEIIDGSFPYGYASAAFGYKFKGEKIVMCPTLGWVKNDDYNSMVLRFAIEF